MSEKTKVDWPDGIWLSVWSGTVQKGDKLMHINDANFVDPEPEDIGETILAFRMVIRKQQMGGK